MKKIFFTSSQWKRVLIEIYRHSPNGYIENHNFKFMSDSHPLAIKLGIKELGYSIGFLRENKLIEDTNSLNPLDEFPINPDWFNRIYLTEKGFSIAFELEKQVRETREKERFEKLQLSMVILTVVLAITGVANILLRLLQL